MFRKLLSTIYMGLLCGGTSRRTSEHAARWAVDALQQSPATAYALAGDPNFTTKSEVGLDLATRAKRRRDRAAARAAIALIRGEALDASGMPTLNTEKLDGALRQLARVHRETVPPLPLRLVRGTRVPNDDARACVRALRLAAQNF